MEELNIIMHTQPSWLVEAMKSVLDTQYEKESLENANHFGKTREEMEKYLEPILQFRTAVKEEMLEVLKNYPIVAEYLKVREEDNFVLDSFTSFVYCMLSILNGGQTKNFKKLVNQCFTAIAGRSDEKAELPEITSLEELLSRLKESEISDAEKFKTIRLYTESEKVFHELKKMQPECERICKKHFHFVNPYFDLFQSELQKIDSIEKFRELTGLIKFSDETVLCVYPEIIEYSKMALLNWEEDGKDNLINCYLGMKVIELIQMKKENKFQNEALIADLKALGDPTRLKLLQQLALKPMYLKELADKLSLTSATISHHLDILLVRQLIIMQIETGKKKVTYEIGKEKLKKLGEQLLGLAE